MRRAFFLSSLLVGCGVGDPTGVTRQALPSTSVVISQLFGSGGATGTTMVPPFRTDFIELHNVSSQPVSLANLSLQYASSMGSNWVVASFDPQASVAPGGFHLVALTASTGARGALLPPADTNNPMIDLARVDLKLGLVDGVAPLSGACPLQGADALRVVDFVGAGTANCFEGATDAGAPSANVSTGLARRGDGCLDTDVNADDFEVVTPAPRSSTSPTIVCFADGGSSGVPDAGPGLDAGSSVDAGPADAGTPVDAGSRIDAGAPDAGAPPADAGVPRDAGATFDAGPATDGGADGGTTPNLTARTGCRCSSVDVAGLLSVLVLLGLRRPRP